MPAWRSASYGLPNPTAALPRDLRPVRRRRLARPGARRRRRRPRQPASSPRAARAATTGGQAFWATTSASSPAIEPWARGGTTAATAPGYFDERGRSRTSTWPTPTSTATPCSTARTTRTTTTSTTSPRCTSPTRTWTATGTPGAATRSGVVPDDRLGGAPHAINPFNPCAPNPDSRTCNDYMPF